MKARCLSQCSFNDATALHNLCVFTMIHKTNHMQILEEKLSVGLKGNINKYNKFILSKFSSIDKYLVD